MAKKREGKPQREVTKRQLSRWQQQKRRQRIFFSSGIFIIIIALGMLGAGWFVTEYKPMHQTLIKVNDTEYDMNYYVKMMEYYGENQPIEYLYSMAEQVVAAIQQNELIRQGAEKLGITTNRDAVDEEMEGRDPPLSKDYRDIIRAELLIKKMREEYFEQEVPEFAEQRHIMVMLLESENQASEVRARLEAGESFTKLAKELSLDDAFEVQDGDLSWRPKGVVAELLGTSVAEDYAFNSDVEVLSQPLYDEDTYKWVGYWIIKVLERTEEPEEANLQVILLGSEKEALEVIARLEADEDFATLAKELSQHEASKVNDGNTKLTPGSTIPEIEEFAFNTDIEIGKISEPIRDDTSITKGGYWLLKVMDIDENRKIEEEDRDTLISKSLSDWLDSVWDDPENVVESFLDDEKKLWAVEKAAGS